MALAHLVDTSVLTRLRMSPVRDRVEAQVHARTLARTSITDLEIGFSARNGAEWDQLAAAIRELELVPTSQHDFVRALDIQRALAVTGHRGRKLPDLLIAAVAERHNLSVLHYDVDFEIISGLTGLRNEWVVPRGTID
ncbi:MAG: PIN domain-containing protein [Actinomycetes bacterium]